MAENSTTMRFWNVYNNIKEFYNEINGATLTGAIDVVVVEQPDGSFTCSPFHVRFGKMGVLRSNLKVVDLELNGVQLDIHMKLGESGEAFFVEEVPEDEVEASAHLATSPIPENGFSIFQEQLMTPRRTSEEYPHEKYENQVSDFTQRRYTDGNSTKPTLAAQKMDYQMLNNDFMYDYKSHYSSSQMNREQDLFMMDNEKDISEAEPKEEKNAPSSAPKRFRAEEVNDKESRAKDTVRKISINNDFKPISAADEEMVIKAITKAEEPIQIAPVDDAQKPQNNAIANKKKKKSKKSGSKKKNMTQRKLSTSSNGYSSQSESTLGPECVETDKTDDRILAEQLANKELIKNASFSTTNLIQDHFFSDTDIPTSAPRSSRSGSPVQSDSELELARGSGVQGSTEPGQSWRWGELPSPLPMTKSTITLSQTQAGESLSSDEESNKTNTNKEDVPVNVASQTSNTSMLSGMFNFMKPSRSLKHNNKKATDGVYLQELAAGAIEPEVAALYFPTPAQANNSAQDKVPRSLPVDIASNTANEEDYESGNGPSLTQSPSSVEGVMGKGMDSDEDEIKIYCKGYIGLSLCGPAVLEQSPAAVAEAFEQESVKFEMLCSDSSLLQNPRLVVRIGNKYMPWSAAAPTLLSLLVYHRPLPKSAVQNLIEVDMKESKPEDSTQGNEKRAQQASGGFNWWPNWRRSVDKQAHDTTLKTGVDIVDGKQTIMDQDKLTQELCEKLKFASNENIAEADEAQESLCQIDSRSQGIAVSTQTSLQSLTDLGGEGYSGSQSAEDSDECTTDKGLISEDMTTSQTKSKSKHSERFRKTLRLSSDEIKKLNLREGMNEMDFSVTTAFQGTTRCKCYVFRWRYDDKIVISDIDGTITKSDVLGHIFPLVGKDWSQSGVAQLFTKIKNNGYKLLYLSARAIGQAKGTRDYLRSIKQGDVSLPDGPLLLNPTSLLRAFHREVIEKKPEEFKIQCLSDIKALFPEDNKPFYAGYGNRVNDVCAYQAVGIPIVRIFTINHRGELKHELTQTFQSSYSNMSYIVDHLFPPVQADVCEDFSQFVFWRQPIADLNEILPTSNSISSLPPIPECQQFGNSAA